MFACVRVCVCVHLFVGLCEQCLCLCLKCVCLVHVLQLSVCAGAKASSLSRGMVDQLQGAVRWGCVYVCVSNPTHCWDRSLYAALRPYCLCRPGPDRCWFFWGRYRNRFLFISRYLEPILLLLPQFTSIKWHNDDNKCYKFQFKKGTFIQLSLNHAEKKYNKINK